MPTTHKASSEKHPPGLPVLFLTEVWERFGFYIVQGMLILYMTHYFGFSDYKSAGILGSFTALAYMMPVIGGVLADRIYGYRGAIILGGFFLIVGYALLALSGKQTFYVALVVIVLGTGLLKPSVSSLLGALYGKAGARRDAGFTIFYVGINMGILLATSSAGFVKEAFGWQVSFALASVGLVIGVLTFWLGRKRLFEHGLPPKPAYIPRWVKTMKSSWGALPIYGMMLLLMLMLFLHSGLANVLFAVAGAGLMLWLIFKAFSYPVDKRNRLLAMLLLVIASVVFWAVFFQMFFSTNLFVDRIVDRQMFGIKIPTVAFISLEAIFILILGPFFAFFWQYLAKKGWNPMVPTKFCIALFVTGLGFYCMAMGLEHRGLDALVNPVWVVGGYFCITLGEIFLSPIGLSAVIKLSPSKMVGMMMGVWFFSLGYGGDIAGILAKRADVPQTITDPFLVGDIYHEAFIQYAMLAAFAGIILLILLPIMKKMIGKYRYL